MHFLSYSKGSVKHFASSIKAGNIPNEYANLSRFERVSKMSIGKEIVVIDFPLKMF